MSDDKKNVTVSTSSKSGDAKVSSKDEPKKESSTEKTSSPDVKSLFNNTLYNLNIPMKKDVFIWLRGEKLTDSRKISAVLAWSKYPRYADKILKNV